MSRKSDIHFVAATVFAFFLVEQTIAVTLRQDFYDPPSLPEFFISEGIQYVSSANTSPPFPKNNVPDPPYSAGRMKSFYDWSKRAMVEHYLDECVPIFPQMTKGERFECTFLNINETSYLITYADTRPSWMPSCCLFEKTFHPPSRHFLENLEASMLSDRSRVNGKPSAWWVVPIEPPTGPFFYAWNLPLRNGTNESQVYATFDFPGIDSWVTQNFVNVKRDKRPPEDTWALPSAQCGTNISTLPACPSLGSIKRRSMRFEKD